MYSAPLRSSLGLLFGLLVALFPHIAAATAPGQVVAWGAGGPGTSGNPNYGQSIVPAGALDGVVAIAAGGIFSVALKDNGTVITWGNDNNPGQITVPAGLNDVIAIASNSEGSHILTLKSNGTLAAWGGNNSGQVTGTTSLGNATANPVVLGGQVLSDVVGIAAGNDFSVVLKSDGTVFAWGESSFGKTSVPVGLTDVMAVAAGFDHTIALKSDGTVVTWGGLNNYGELNVPAGLNNVVAVAAANFYSMALKSDGTVVAWGNYYYGPITVPGGLSNVVAISAGVSSTMALKSDGTIVAWGHNDDGEITIPPAAQSCVLAISAGSYHSLALVTAAPMVTTPPHSQVRLTGQTAIFSATLSGSPPDSYQWYKDGVALADDGRIVGSHAAVLYVNLLTQADEGNYHLEVANCNGSDVSTAAVLTVNNQTPPGAVIAWGDDTYGQSDVPAAANSGVIAVAAGQGHTLALKSSGQLLAWGWNTSGQTNIPLATLNGSVAIAAGQGHSLALRNDGVVLAWGNDADGQTNVPSGLADVIAIAAGGAQSLALKNDGTVLAWGNNSSNVPAGLTNVTAIAAGMYHALALKSDSTVVAWGDDSHGKSTVPTGLTDVVAIAAGFYHSLAVKADGTVIAWGDDSDGQSTVPGGLINAVGAAGGRYHSVARINDKTLVAWGDDSAGQSTIPGNVQGRVLALAAGWMHTVIIAGHTPIILSGPVTAYANLNHDILFHVDVDGTPPFHFQWRMQSAAGSSDIPGATDATLTLKNVQSTDAGGYAVVVSNDFGTVAGSASLTVLPATTFSAWQQSRFTSEELADPAISGPLADPSGMGTANLLKYALNLESMGGAGGPSIPSSPWPFQPVLTGGTLMLTFRALRTDVTYTIESSTDLSTWSTSGVTTQYNGIDCTATCLPAASPRMFLRLKVEMP